MGYAIGADHQEGKAVMSVAVALSLMAVGVTADDGLGPTWHTPTGDVMNAEVVPGA